MKTRAKFKLTEKIQREGGSELKFSVVTTGSEENKEFFKWTPYGQLSMGLVNESTAGQFEVGKEYYLDLTAAVEVAAETDQV